MNTLGKLIDAVLFLFFLAVAFAAPLFDGQACFPHHFFPAFLVDLKTWYAREYGDYLFSEKPHFFVGLMWIQLVFQWPLALACVYGMIGGKPWLRTTCLIYGASLFTTMVAILAELQLSNRASDRLLSLYYPFLGFAVVAVLRGLFGDSGKSSTTGRRPPVQRKKRA